jgi:hypothetical protein
MGHEMKVRWVYHVACRGQTKYVYMILVVNPGRKRPLGILHGHGRILFNWI